MYHPVFANLAAILISLLVLAGCSSVTKGPADDVTLETLEVVRNLGSDDFLFVFTPTETRSIYQNMAWLQKNNGSPYICDFFRVSRVSQLCSIYKKINSLEWTRVKWFMYNATLRDACGLYVLDFAPWRGPKVRAATSMWDGQAIPWITLGRTAAIKTSTTGQGVVARCTS